MGPRSVVLADLLTRAGLAASRAEAKRLIAGGAVQLDGERVEGPEVRVAPGGVLRVGRRRWLRLIAGA